MEEIIFFCYSFRYLYLEWNDSGHSQYVGVDFKNKFTEKETCKWNVVVSEVRVSITYIAREEFPSHLMCYTDWHEPWKFWEISKKFYVDLQL